MKNLLIAVLLALIATTLAQQAQAGTRVDENLPHLTTPAPAGSLIPAIQTVPGETSVTVQIELTGEKYKYLAADGSLKPVPGKAWQILEEYDQGDLVTYFNGSSWGVYTSKSNVNTGNLPTDTVWWEIDSGGGVIAASEVTFVPTGSVQSNTVQDAIVEIAIESGSGVGIDDTAGDGDLDVTWSASKSYNGILIATELIYHADCSASGMTTGLCVETTDGSLWYWNNTDVVQLTGGGGGTVDSVNGYTGIVVLDPDDLDDALTTNKFMTTAEKAIIAGLGTVSTRNVEDTMTNGSNIPDGAAVIAYGNSNWDQSGVIITDFTGTANRILWINGTGSVSEVVLGANGTVFTSNGATVAPSFEAAAGIGDALQSLGLDQFAITTSAELWGVISNPIGTVTDNLLFGDQGVSTTDSPTFAEITTAASANPSWHFDSISAQDFWIGGNDASGAFEIRGSSTAGTNVKFRFDYATGSIYLGGLTNDAYFFQIDVQDPTGSRRVQYDDVSVEWSQSTAGWVMTYNSTNTTWEPAAPAAGSTSDSFRTINVPAGTNPVADSSTDTLNITGGDGVNVTGTDTTDTLHITYNATEAKTANEGIIDVGNLQGTVGDAQVPATFTRDTEVQQKYISGTEADFYFTFHPETVYDSNATHAATIVTRLPADVTFTRLLMSCDVDPAVEVSFALRRRAFGIGFLTPATIHNGSTVAGVLDTPSLVSGSVAAGQKIFLELSGTYADVSECSITLEGDWD